MNYDVIVVGARCAGAMLGTLLAKSGAKTLMLDADELPSDMAMSTHLIQPPGMDALDEVGVGAQVRACTPATKRMHIRVGPHDAFPTFERRPAYCVRRSVVDPMLQAAATAAGAELRDRSRVVELVKDGERVTGVVVEGASGRETLRAKLVVGADGRNSTVARLTGVEEYLTAPMTRGVYFFYFPTPALWHTDARYAEHQSFIGWEGDGLRYVFECDGDQLLLVAAPPVDEARTWGAAYKEKFIEYLKASEVTRPLVEASRPLGKGMGLLKAQYYYRRPVGPGFALIGDAGNFKDYVTGHGMTDAYLSAKRLHRAILGDTEADYLRFWRERDVETLPLYLDSLRLGEVGFNDAFARALFERCGRSPELTQRFLRVADRQISPFEAFSPIELGSIVFANVVRGRFDVLKAFLTTGKRMAGNQAELKRRAALLAELGGTSRAPLPAVPAVAAE